MTIRDDEAVIPYGIHEKDAYVDQGEIVDNKRLGAVLRHIQNEQKQRDEKFLARYDVTKRRAAQYEKRAAKAKKS